MSAVETKEIQAASTTTLTEAKAFKIATAAQFSEAGAKLVGIMALKKKIAETFDKHIANAFKAHKDLVAEKKEHENPLIEAEGYIKRAMLGYQQEQERIRREAEAKAQEEARKQREKLEAQAAKAIEKGKTEKAEALQVAAASVVVPILVSTMPKVAGISTRITYKASVTDKAALIEAVAGGRRRVQRSFDGDQRRRAMVVPIIAVDANSTFLNQQARAMKSTLAYPGVTVEQETGIANRSA